MYVTVRLFGILREARTFAMGHDIVEQIGQPSDLDHLNQHIVQNRSTPQDQTMQGYTRQNQMGNTAPSQQQSGVQPQRNHQNTSIDQWQAHTPSSDGQAAEAEDQVVPRLPDDHPTLAAQSKGKQITEGPPPFLTQPPTTRLLPTTQEHHRLHTQASPHAERATGYQHIEEQA
jgi:hypothetical protein